ncbi:MAG TPA: lysophospholipid acyltransferase family protein [Aliidongia sp.]|uniref:lysophospholipid acyltransferase family protein n=1 Tax=Aliidongia sp. TaxID=1914230 RepID=UPI002DDC9729|nr:lysophospholipid acyltransferase family protein [Aliidongia sp.]HEV2677639.1 lysophospholipid acyltransferase family protein [Aliidongia sp.]
MKALRALVYNIGFFGGSGLLMTLALPLLVFPRRWTNGLAHLWTWLMFTWLRLVVGLDYEVRGRENLPAGPAILAMKHQSAWDTLAIFVLFDDPAVVLKRELWLIPVFGWFLRKHGTIAIDRDGKAAALKKLLADAEVAKAAGRPIAIFPEGTRGPVGTKLPYQAGVAALYTQLKVPMVPIALNSGLYWGRRAFMKRSGTVLVQILPAIPPGLDRRKMMARLEQDIETTTNALLVEGGWEKPVENSVDQLASNR